MFYAIIKQTTTTGPSSSPVTNPPAFTGVVYDYITDEIINPHKDQGYFIEPRNTTIMPTNQAEIMQAEMQNVMTPSAGIIVPVPEYPVITKENAVNAVNFYINEKKKKENKKNFIYDNHEYFSDVDSIQATQNQCLTMNDTDAIPTVNGKWKTAEFESDGITSVYVDFIVSDFKLFAKSLFDRGASNFGIKEIHQQQVNAMISDDTKTVQDIFDYDFSGSWV